MMHRDGLFKLRLIALAGEFSRAYDSLLQKGQ